MDRILDGNAIVYCEGAFNTTNGKTAHGLVRRTGRYHVLSVVDACYTGKDAGQVLDGKPSRIPVFEDIARAIADAKKKGSPATHLVIGLAPDGGRLSSRSREDVISAINMGLNVDSGLHDFLSDDPEMVNLAGQHNVQIRDIRKPPLRKDLHFFSGKIEEVKSQKVAILGTDSAVGKRTTVWLIADALIKQGYKTEVIGTGQTAWMQGVRYGIVMDSLVNDFVSGEIEHVVWSAWHEQKPDVILIEGQGSLMNPAYPGGFEILAAGRPDVVVLQHAPMRKEYDGFPGYLLHDLRTQIQAIEFLSGKPVVAVTVNHENMTRESLPSVCAKITRETGLVVCDPIWEGADRIVEALEVRK